MLSTLLQCCIVIVMQINLPVAIIVASEVVEIRKLFLLVVSAKESSKQKFIT